MDKPMLSIIIGVNAHIPDVNWEAGMAIASDRAEH